MKQYTTPVLRLRMAGMSEVLAGASLVEVALRRDDVELRLEAEVDGEVVSVRLTEDQTGSLCSTRGTVSAEVTVVGNGVAKSETFWLEAVPSVRSEAVGYSGTGDDVSEEDVDVDLACELVFVESPYVLPAASTVVLGGVMVGRGLSVGGDGLLSAEVAAADLSSVLGEAAAAREAAESAAASASAAALAIDEAIGGSY